MILAGALASEKGSEDAIDKAVRKGVKDPKALEAYTVKKFVPFDPVGKRTESEVTNAQGEALRYTKGAPQVIIELSTLDADAAAKATQTEADLAAKGLRALRIAESADKGKTWRFLGILAMLDPPRDDSKETIQFAKQHGLQVKMVTGDGVNDAPALKQADCGIAVSGATDAARAAAALILTAPGLSTVIDAIDESRRIFERIINYVLFRVAMTLDIMFVVVLATIFFGFSPLTVP